MNDLIMVLLIALIGLAVQVATNKINKKVNSFTTWRNNINNYPKH